MHASQNTKTNRYAIELYFDDETRAKLETLWRVLNKHGLIKILCPERGYVPHISLAVAAEINPAEIVPLVRAFAARVGPLTIALTHIGVFNNVDSSLWFGPNFSNELRSVHLELWDSLRRTKVEWLNYYTPENWVPHCAIIANRPFDVVSKGLELCRDFKLPLLGRLDLITLVDFIEGTEFCLEPLKGGTE
jgi:2'-5' RNA ligase